MKAIVYENYGPPDVLKLKEVPKPSITDDQVLVRVVAAAANPLDWHLIRGEPFIARIEMGLFKPKVNIPGADIAGWVEAVGKNVIQFKPGDAVFGSPYEFTLGGFAEFMAIKAEGLVHKPDNVTFEQAAAVPVAALTALQGLRFGGIQAGQDVLINGASGGVGTSAVQIARARGAEVTGVCSTRNLDLVRSIGAEHVIDYTQQDFTKIGKQYDLIFDCVGNRSVADLKRALKPNGTASIAGFTSMGRMLEHQIIGPLQSKPAGKTVKMMPTAKTLQEDLVILRDYLAEGALIPVIDRCYPLAEAPEAIAYLETMRARGKVIIKVENAGTTHDGSR